MAKKRKETPPSATLHDYFSKPDGQRAGKKPKVQPSPSLRMKKKTTAERKVPTNVEIILIDSDDEVAEICLPTKLTAAPSRGEARATFATADPELDDDKFVLTGLLPVGGVDGDRNLSVPSTSAQSLVRMAQSAVRADNTGREPSPFGVPSLLLGSGAILSPSSLPVPAASSSTATQVVKDSVKSSSATTPSVEAEACEVANILEIPDSDDHWGTGDDEIDFVDPEIQDAKDVDIDLTLDVETCEEMEIDLTLDEGGNSSSTGQNDCVEQCPLCEMSLRGLRQEAVQKHVNDCIDNMTSPNTGPVFPKSEVSPEAMPHAVTGPFTKAESPSAGSSVLSRPIQRKSTPGSDVSAFAALMSSNKEVEAWKEASVAEDRNFRPTRANRRHAPFYKVLQGMPIAVDAFRYGSIPEITAYFLTHAHSDHYTNLSSNWRSGPIYCSEGTGNLIVHMLGVDRKWVRPLPMDVPTIVPDTGGVSVTLIEANHCPGSCLFLFEGPQTVNAGDSAYKSPFVGTKRIFRYLHCGDFRASPQHVLHPCVKGKRLDHVYLDTTYLDPKYCFPPQPQVIAACAELARRIVRGESLEDGDLKGKKRETMDGWITVHEKAYKKEESAAGRVLFIVGTYSIGKERIVKAIARALGTKIFCDSRKEAILRCEADPELDALLTRDPLEGAVHLVPLGVIASDRLKDYIGRFKGHYSRAVGFRPTGWTYTPPSGTDTTNIPSIPALIKRAQSRTYTFANLRPTKNSSPGLQVYGVPYSEHSSFVELSAFALSFDWCRMIATVNVGSESGRKKMSRWIERWEAERKKGGGMTVQQRAPDYW